MATQIVLLNNLGKTLKPAHTTPGKIDVQLDQTTLKVDANGIISVNTATGAGESAALKALIRAQETATTMAYNAVTKVLTYTNEKAVVATIDLSALALDVYVNGGSYNASTMALTLTDSSGTTPDIVINLAELKQVAKSSSNTVTITGTGETLTPLIAEVKIDPIANVITQSAAGIKVSAASVAALATVDVQDAFGVSIFTAFPAII